MNLPNKITLFRIFVFIPVFLIALLIEFPYHNIIAAILFILGALSDVLDGYLARKQKQITNMGKLLDPVADKLLITAGLIFLIGKGVEPWMAFIIIAREFLVTGYRLAAQSLGKTIPAGNWGKAKTASQVIAIVAVIIQFQYSWHLMLIAVILTAYSGITYLFSAKEVWKG